MKVMPTDDTLNPWRWPLHILVTTCFLAGFLTRFAWATLSPEIGPSLNFDNARIGSYMSAFYLGYVLTQAPAGLLADRFGVRLILGGALVTQALSTWLLTLSTGYEAGFAWRVVAGLGAGMVYSACVRSVVSLFPDREKSVAFGVLMSAPTVGVLLPNLALPYFNTLWGWTGAFNLVAVFCLLTGLAAFSLLGGVHARAGGPKPRFMDGLKFVLSRKPIIFMAASGFCLLWSMVGLVSWTNTYLTRLNYDTNQAAEIMIVYGVGGILGSLIWGFTAAKMNRTGWRRALIGCLALLAPAILLFSRQTDWWPLAGLAAGLGFLIGGANALIPILVADFSGRVWAGAAGGLTGIVFQLGGLISPWLLGFIVDRQQGSFSLVWWLLAAGTLLGACLALGARESRSAS